MKTVNDLLNIFGGTRPAARAFKKPSSTVHNWRLNGIPANVEVLEMIQAKLSGEGVKTTLDGLLRLRCEK